MKLVILAPPAKLSHKPTTQHFGSSRITPARHQRQLAETFGRLAEIQHAAGDWESARKNLREGHFRLDPTDGG